MGDGITDVIIGIQFWQAGIGIFRCPAIVKHLPGTVAAKTIHVGPPFGIVVDLIAVIPKSKDIQIEVFISYIHIEAGLEFWMRAA